MTVLWCWTKWYFEVEQHLQSTIIRLGPLRVIVSK